MKQISNREADQISKMELLNEYDTKMEKARAEYKHNRDSIISSILGYEDTILMGVQLLGLCIISGFFFAIYAVPVHAYIGMSLVLIYTAMATDIIYQNTKIRKKIAELRELLNELGSSHMLMIEGHRQLRETVLRVCNGEE